MGTDARSSSKELTLADILTNRDAVAAFVWEGYFLLLDLGLFVGALGASVALWAFRGRRGESISVILSVEVDWSSGTLLGRLSATLLARDRRGFGLLGLGLVAVLRLHFGAAGALAKLSEAMGDGLWGAVCRKLAMDPC
jgi:hypothetical protein